MNEQLLKVKQPSVKDLFKTVKKNERGWRGGGFHRYTQIRGLKSAPTKSVPGAVANSRIDSLKKIGIFLLTSPGNKALMLPKG